MHGHLITFLTAVGRGWGLGRGRGYFLGHEISFFSPLGRRSCMIFLVSILSLCKNFFIINLKIMILESTCSIFFPWLPLHNFCFSIFCSTGIYFLAIATRPPPPTPLINEKRHQSKNMVTQLTLISVTHSVMTLSSLALTTFLHKSKILRISLLQRLIAFLRVIPDGVGQVGTRYLTLAGLNT